MLDGDPGLGKSFLTLDLCARLSTGRPMPDGSLGPGLGNALILNAEDSEQDTIRPRLMALGGDLDRIFVLRCGEDPGELLRLPAHTAMLEEALRQTQARLVVLDPIIAFLDRSVCYQSDQSVRTALQPLSALAHKAACVMILVRHLNKKLGGRSLYRGGGSIGFLGACRSGWLVGIDPAQPGQRLLAQVKNSLGPPQSSLVYALEGEAGAPPRLNWRGTSPLSADELLAGVAEGGRRRRPHEVAADFLAEFLGEKPRTSREILGGGPAARPGRADLVPCQAGLTGAGPVGPGRSGPALLLAASGPETARGGRVRPGTVAGTACARSTRPPRPWTISERLIPDPTPRLPPRSPLIDGRGENEEWLVRSPPAHQ